MTVFRCTTSRLISLIWHCVKSLSARGKTKCISIQILYGLLLWYFFFFFFRMFELDSSSPHLLSLYGKRLSQDIVQYFIFHGRQKVIEFGTTRGRGNDDRCSLWVNYSFNKRCTFHYNMQTLHWFSCSPLKNNLFKSHHWYWTAQGRHCGRALSNNASGTQG